jgi:hypothetical protein
MMTAYTESSDTLMMFQRFEILTVVKMSIVVSWTVMSCELPAFQRNVGNRLWDHSTRWPRKLKRHYDLVPWKQSTYLSKKTSFGEIWGFHGRENDVSEENTVSIFRAEGGDSMFLRNFGIYRRVYILHGSKTQKNIIIKLLSYYCARLQVTYRS